jgi:uncharacterized protein YcbX
VRRVAEIWIYPVKSCRGGRVPHATLAERGLDGDRRWMIVDAASGKFLTLREIPTMQLAHARLDGDVLVVDAPGLPTLRRPARLADGTRRTVEVWRDTVEAIADAEASAWFSRHLGRQVDAVYMPDTTHREVDRDHGGRADDVVSFADAFPLLVCARESLADLNRRIGGAPLAMERFRPNVVIEGGAPWEEDALGRFRIGATTFRNAKGCSRCAATTVDPDTAERGPEPLRTLADFRRKDDGKVYFGINAIHEGPGAIAVWDGVEPIS